MSAAGSGSGRFAQVSGIRFSYSPAQPKGDRILEVIVGGKPLDKSRTYTLATSDYFARGGDEYESLKKGKLIVDALGGTLMASQVIDYIAELGTVAPKIEGRIEAK